jgi:hypothetical protein
MADGSTERRLWELPADVLAMVTEMSGATSAIFLWLSGSSALRFVLSRAGGVTHIRLSDPSFYSTSRWPMLIGQLSGLKSLHIRAARSALCFPVSAMDAVLSLDNLQELDIFSMKADHLIKKLSHSFIPGSTKQYLPQLRDLRFSTHKLPKSGLNLPKSLTSLEVQLKATVGTEGTMFSNINYSLPFLSCLILQGPFVSSDQKLVTVFSTLQLTELKVCVHDNKLHRYLPRTLTILDLAIRGSDIADFLDLPPSLTDLRVSARSANMENLKEHLFPHLTSLELHLWATLETNSPYALAFPRTLLHLNLNCNVTPWRIVLPPYLRTLMISFLRTAYIETECVEEDLPLVETLQHHPVAGRDDPIKSREGCPFTLLKLQIRGSTHRHMTGNFHPNFIGKEYPQKIESIQVGDDSFLPGRGNFYRLPGATLTELTCFSVGSNPNLSQFTRLTRLELHTLGDAPNQWISTFPPSLTSLTLNSLSSKWLTPACFQYFNRGMVKLRLSQREGNKIAGITEKDFQVLQSFDMLEDLELSFEMDDIEDSSFEFLPKSLRYLKLDGSCEFLTSGCFKHLPRNLHTLRLRNFSQLNNLEVIDLPRKLRVLELPALTTFSEWAGQSLPTGLTQFNISSMETKNIGRYRGQTGYLPVLEAKYVRSTNPDSRLPNNSVNFTWKAPSFDNPPDHHSASSQELRRIRRKSRLMWVASITVLSFGIIAAISRTWQEVTNTQ